MRPDQPSSTPGTLLALIRKGGQFTRAELVESTGMARSTVADRLERLAERGLIYPAGEESSTGGRRPATFAFNEQARVVLAADVGATHTRLAVSDLAARPLAEATEDRPVAGDPRPFVSWMIKRWTDLLRECGRCADDVLGVGVGLPAPVAFRAGAPYRPPIMPGWNEFPLADVLHATFHARVLVDNDVNLMALGEQWSNWQHASHLVFVKIGSGIGSGIVSEGRVYRGADGAAGDIGHLAVEGYDDVRCPCGHSACLEAVAGGAALAQKLRAAGLETNDSRDVVELVKQGHLQATQEVRNAGQVIGGTLALVINVLNPKVLVIGGDMAHADEQLLPGIRAAIYARSLTLATRQLQVVRSTLDDRAGVIGAAVMTIEDVLSPEAIDHDLTQTPPENSQDFDLAVST